MTVGVARRIVASALLFDMDGTLVDSHASIEAVWFAFADRHGIDRRVVAAALPGRIASDIITTVLGSHADVSTELQWIRLQEERTTESVGPVAGAREVLESVPDGQWAVVTSAPRAMMTRRLSAAGLPIPRTAVCAEDVRVGKPAPEGFLVAAAQLGVDIGTCVAFEDSAVGMVSVARSGAACIAVGDEPGTHVARVRDFRSVRVGAADSSLVVDIL